MFVSMEKPIAEGVYQVEVNSILASEDTTEKPIKVIFKIVDKPEFSREVYGNISRQHHHKLVSWVETLLGTEVTGKKTIDLRDLIGKRAMAKLIYTAKGDLRTYELLPLNSKKDPRILLKAENSIL
ncbi:hypothetical protein K2P97_07395 [bacterium]|nr:hypothetical protein [bacterium]